MTAGMIAVPTIIPLKEPGSILAGSRKWMVTTNTLIELATDSKDCLLFYTIDGTKPDPFKKMGNRTTHQYVRPFTLHRGKRTVKAIAVLRDGSRESSINTKVFTVDEPELLSDEELNTTNTSWAAQPMSDEDEVILAAALESNQTFKGILRNSPTGRKTKTPTTNGDLIKRVITDFPRTPTNVDPRMTQEDNSFRCFHCNTERPRDPYARFCNGCGLGLPPAPGGVRTSQYFSAAVNCDNCGYEKASESSFCRVCDSITKCSKPLKQRIHCENCDSMNPITVEACLVCDEPLDNHFLKNNMINTSQIHQPCSDFIQCPFCERVNSGDARFCDWCGKKPQTAPVTFTCERCKADNSLYSEYCCSCGNTLETPMRKSFKEHLNKEDLIVENGHSPGVEKSKEKSWKKMKLQKVSRKPSKDVAIQAGENLALDESPSKWKSNPLYHLSPGKGYWRQQVEHICHHLKLFTQNNLEFRESIANFVMTRMISAIAAQSEESELVLTTKFALKDGGKNLKTMKGSASALTFMSALSASIKTKDLKRESIGSRPTSARSRPTSARSRPTSARSRTSSTSSRPGSGKKKKKGLKTYEKIEKEKVNAKLSKLSMESLKILNMIKSTKALDEEKAEELIKADDFDANAVDESSIPLLKLSVMHKQYPLIPFLVEAGADVDKTSGSKNTSALHEAVSLGINGRDAVSLLIENGASQEVKDKKGQSAFDAAVESGINALIEKFTKMTSKQMINDVKF